ncbi:TPA: hypothetical protein ACHJTH_005289, partial [Escherichia coli]
SRFAKGITKIIIPSAGGVRLRGLFVMLPTDSTRRRINPRGVLTLAEEKHESVVFTGAVSGLFLANHSLHTWLFPVNL